VLFIPSIDGESLVVQNLKKLSVWVVRLFGDVYITARCFDIF